MKKVILILGCILFINSINGFSQSIDKSKKEFKTKTKTVYGYLNNFSELYYLGINFEKVIYSVDTSYYVILRLTSPSSEYHTDICINKANSIKFLTKSGRFVDLKMTDMSSLIQSDNLTNDLSAIIKEDNYFTTLKLEVTKEELIEISSEPFYRILLPYFDCSTQVYNEIKFVKPTLFTRRIFIQKNINYILNI